MRLIDAHNISMQIVELYNGEKDVKVKSTMREIMKLIRESPTVPLPPSNDPLTLDELRKMERGSSIWIFYLGHGANALINSIDEKAIDVKTVFQDLKMLWEDYRTLWSAYRREPEGDAK